MQLDPATLAERAAAAKAANDFEKPFREYCDPTTNVFPNEVAPAVATHRVLSVRNYGAAQLQRAVVAWFASAEDAQRCADTLNAAAPTSWPSDGVTFEVEQR